MTTHSMMQRGRRSPPEIPTHRYAVGQAVWLRGGFGRPSAASDIYHITATLPPNGNSPQYRIRNDDERHERVTTQDNLEAVSTVQADEGATLIERTFSHGKGTKTQQSRDPQTEASEGSTAA